MHKKLDWPRGSLAVDSEHAEFAAPPSQACHTVRSASIAGGGRRCANKATTPRGSTDMRFDFVYCHRRRIKTLHHLAMARKAPSPKQMVCHNGKGRRKPNNYQQSAIMESSLWRHLRATWLQTRSPHPQADCLCGTSESLPAQRRRRLLEARQPSRPDLGSGCQNQRSTYCMRARPRCRAEHPGTILVH